MDESFSGVRRRSISDFQSGSFGSGIFGLGDAIDAGDEFAPIAKLCREDFAAVARPDIAAQIAALPARPARLRALSPFDPLLRDRSRAERIFGFAYRIEVYVPHHKRKHGYYVFPLLEGDRLVGRIDIKAEREQDRLLVKGLWMEKGLSLGKQRRAKLEQELARQARFAGVRDIVFPNSAIKTG